MAYETITSDVDLSCFSIREPRSTGITVHATNRPAQKEKARKNGLRARHPLPTRVMSRSESETVLSVVLPRGVSSSGPGIEPLGTLASRPGRDTHLVFQGVHPCLQLVHLLLFRRQGHGGIDLQRPSTKASGALRKGLREPDNAGIR